MSRKTSLVLASALIPVPVLDPRIRDSYFESGYWDPVVVARGRKLLRDIVAIYAAKVNGGTAAKPFNESST